MNAQKTFQVKSLSLKGDGLADSPEGPIYQPFCLPGEEIIISENGSIDVKQASSDRQKPICQYFTQCGGCRMQHANDGLIANWKLEIAKHHFARAGLHPELHFQTAHQSGRRRVSLHVRQIEDRICAGFMQAKSHSLLDIAQCPLLTPALNANAFHFAKQLGETLLPSFKPFDAHITDTQSGLDVDLRGLGKLNEKLRLRLSQAAMQLGLARLSIHGDMISQSRSPSLTIGKAQVILPPGGFLQATQDAEIFMTQQAKQALVGSRKIIDLFCGIGPFALRLADEASIIAADMDPAAIASLDHAIRNTPGLKPIKAEKRDLFRMPYLARELQGLDAAIIDPPRAGAEAQMRELAKSSLKRIFAVGCDAQSFSRDAAILTKAGWNMGPVTVLDQFRYAPHIELMALFTRKAK